MLGLKLVFFLVIAVFVAIFAMQNPIPVTIKLFAWESAEISLVIVIFCSILVGFIWALILASIRIVSLKLQLQKLKDYIDIKDSVSHKPGVMLK